MQTYTRNFGSRKKASKYHHRYSIYGITEHDPVCFKVRILETACTCAMPIRNTFSAPTTIIIIMLDLYTYKLEATVTSIQHICQCQIHNMYNSGT